MRTLSEPLRKAASYELVSVVLGLPILSGLHDQGYGPMFLLLTLGSVIAATWNLVFTRVVENSLKKRTRRTGMQHHWTMDHALAYEAVLLAIMLPVTSWALGISFFQAFIVSATISAYYAIYSVAFTWVYGAFISDPENAY
ncbi:chlorhexidine efflux transporter [Roseivivax sp. CAU 1761]